MANIFNFKNSLFGFKKKDVVDHIDNMNSIHARKIKEKEEEYNILLDKYKKIEELYNKTAVELSDSNDEKEATKVALTTVLGSLSETKEKLAISQSRVEELEALRLEREVLDAEKEKIAQAWIVSAEKAESMIVEAKETAENIINEAIITSETEKKAIEVKIDNEREKLIDIKREMRDLKNSFVAMLKKYGEEIDSKVDEYDDVSGEVQAEIDNEDSFGMAVPELPDDFGRSLRPETELENTGNVLSFVDFVEDDEDSSVTIL